MILPISIPLISKLSGSQLSVETPVEWLTDPARSYPVLIDPVVTTQGVLNNGPGGVDGTRIRPFAGRTAVIII